MYRILFAYSEHSNVKAHYFLTLSEAEDFLDLHRCAKNFIKHYTKEEFDKDPYEKVRHYSEKLTDLFE